MVAVGIAACGTSAPAEIRSSPPVTGTGKHFSYSQAGVPMSKWPDPCSLLTQSAGEAALGTTISVRRFHTSCYYQPGSAEYPTLTISLLAVGTSSGSSYHAVSVDNEGLERRSIPGVGLEAYLHRVRHLPAVTLNVLTRNAHFAVSEQSPVGQQISLASARYLLVSVGKVVAREFNR